MRGLFVSAAAALALAVSPALAAEQVQQAEVTDEAMTTSAAQGGASWYDELGEAAIPGDELYEKYAHVEEELEKLDAEPRPEYAPLGQ